MQGIVESASHTSQSMVVRKPIATFIFVARGVQLHAT